MKKSLHNQRLIEILFEMKYNLEYSFECYDFLGEDLSAEGEVNPALGPLFALNQERASQAFLKQVGFLKDKDKLVRQKIMLVEAANATLYGWKVVNHLEPEKEIFSELQCPQLGLFFRTLVRIRTFSPKKSGKSLFFAPKVWIFIKWLHIIPFWNP